MANFQLEDFTRRGEKILANTRKIFADYKDLKTQYGNLSIDENILPKTMQPADGAIKLVFVGQYSAGKSSIIKMLTGIDVTIGAGIATQEAHAYKWGDLEIVDTPGIHTEIEGSDHDEKTYYQIDHAALLIFVVTAQGFDNRMGNHFRKLAFEQDRAKNMVLVVNKMDQTALGNVPEQQKIIAEDLKKVFVDTSYTPDQLYLSFTNTGYYFDWQTETDAEMKEILLEQSGYEKFVENLNSFAASRGVVSKIQGPLETLKSAVTNVFGELREADIDKDINKIEEILKGKQTAIADGKRKIKVGIAELANACAQKIKVEGDRVAELIVPGVSEEEINRKIEAAQSQSELYVQRCEADMIERLSSICEGIVEDIRFVDRSNLAENIRNNLKNKSGSLAVIQNSNLPQYETDGDKLGKFGQNMITTEAMAGLFNLTAKGAASVAIPALGNLKAASIVKDLGHFLNFKFQPWGAVNLIKNVSNFLGAAGLIYTAWQALKKLSGEEERKLNEAIRSAKNEVHKGFDEYADSVNREFVNAATGKMDELTAPILKAAQDNLKQFQINKERIKNLAHSLKEILGEIKILMDEVQQTVKA